MKASDPFFPPLLHLQQQCLQGCSPQAYALRVTAWGAQPGGGIPSGVGPKGCSKSHQSEVQLRGVQGSVPEGYTLEGSSP